MESNVFIREALESDTERIKKFDSEVVLHVASLSGDKDLNEVKRRHDEVFDRWFSLGNHKVYLAFEKERPEELIGFIWIIKNVEQFTGIPYCYIMDIGVKKDYRNKGLGKLLMKKAEEYTRECGYDRIKLMVNVNNKNAIKFYRSLGFWPEDLYMRKEVE